jgi:hypothetical protein
MQPIFQLWLVFSLWLHKLVFFVRWVLCFYFKLRSILLCWLRKFVHTSWNYSCPVRDSCDLSSKVMLFFTKEERISYDLFFKVTREENFNLPGCFNVARHQIWETLPVWKSWVCYVISILIYSLSARLKSRSFVLLSVIRVYLRFSCTFSDVIVLFSSINLSPKLETLCACFES